MKKSALFTLSFVSVLGLAKVFSIVPFTRMAADDFSSAIIARQGIWKAFVFTYTTWFGRFSSILMESTIVSNIGDSGNIVFYTFLTFALLFLAFIIFYKKLFGVSFKNIYPHTFAGVSFATLYLLTPNKVESWYWLTGSVTYLWPITFSLLAFSFLFNKRHTRKDYILSSLFIFIATACNEIFGFLAVIILLGLTYVAWSKKRVRGVILSMLSAASLSLLIMLLAPGNAIRLQVPGSDQMSLVGTLLYSVQIGPPHLLSMIKESAFFLLPLVFVLTFAFSQMNILIGKENTEKLLVRIFTLVVVTFVLSIFHMLPGVYGLGRVPPNRIDVTLAFIVVLLTVSIAFYMSQLIRAEKLEKRFSYKVFISIACITLFVASFVFTNTLSEDVYTARNYSLAYDAMIASFKEARARGDMKTIIVKLPDAGLIPVTLDPPRDNDYKNQALSEFYGVGKIFSE